ncbi:hypothetical protein RI367_004929 [Sorochytrium milnesiophthora]
MLRCWALLAAVAVLACGDGVYARSNQRLAAPPTHLSWRLKAFATADGGNGGMTASPAGSSTELVPGAGPTPQGGNQEQAQPPAKPVFWDVLAPLAMGEFGADPYQAYLNGKTWVQPSSANQSYVSDFVDGGLITWQRIQGDNDGNIALQFAMDEDLLTSMFGIAGLQWRGWALTTFDIAQDGVYQFIQPYRRFYIDDKDVIGDPYGVLPSFAHLTKGTHTLRVAISGYGNSSSVNYIQPQLLNPFQGVVLTTNPAETLVPDLINGYPAGTHLAVVVTNVGKDDIGSRQLRARLTLADATVKSPCGNDLPSVVFNHSLYSLQSAPLAIPFGCFASKQLQVPTNTSAVAFNVTLERVGGASAELLTTQVSLRVRSWGQDYKMTFLDRMDNSVQTAGVKPPAKACSGAGCPVMFSTHGAGVIGEGDVWLSSYQQQQQAWVLLPTNRRPYGYDWQTVGMVVQVNGVNALGALAQLQPGVPPELRPQFKVDAQRLLITGHSMGGHGAWMYSTHYPDLAVAVMPACAWLKQAHYLPKFMYSDNSRLDPFARSLFDRSLSEYDAELYVGNIKGLPLMTRNGMRDDTVPPLFNRRMARMVDEDADNPGWSQLNEVPNVGHWFDGVVEDPSLQKFYDQYLLPQPAPFPALPTEFSVSAMNVANMGSRGGLLILQPVVPFHTLSQIQVRRRSSQEWILHTRNVRRFTFVQHPAYTPPRLVVIDGNSLPAAVQPTAGTTAAPAAHYCRLQEGDPWRVCPASQDWTASERSSATMGPARRVYETAPIAIVYDSSSSLFRELALDHARELYHQGRFSAAVMSVDDHAVPPGYNVVYIGMPRGWQKLASDLGTPPAETMAYNRGFTVGTTRYTDPSLALVSLAPLRREPGRLVLLLTGNSEQAVEKAATLAPITSASPMPDYAVFDAAQSWKGTGSAIAAGYYDINWRVDSHTSYKA